MSLQAVGRPYTAITQLLKTVVLRFSRILPTHAFLIWELIDACLEGCEVISNRSLQLCYDWCGVAKALGLIYWARARFQIDFERKDFMQGKMSKFSKLTSTHMAHREQWIMQWVHKSHPHVAVCRAEMIQKQVQSTHQQGPSIHVCRVGINLIGKTELVPLCSTRTWLVRVIMDCYKRIFCYLRLGLSETWWTWNCRMTMLLRIVQLLWHSWKSSLESTLPWPARFPDISQLSMCRITSSAGPITGPTSVDTATVAINMDCRWATDSPAFSEMPVKIKAFLSASITYNQDIEYTFHLIY